MRKWFLLIVVLISSIFITVEVPAQNKIADKLKVFIDCSNTWCDMNFIRTEINLVDFMLDRQAADVHVLITEQNTGGGGNQFQLIFFGQHEFKNNKDTIRCTTDPNATDFEERELLINYLKLGLSPFVAKTKMAKAIVIQMKTKDVGSQGKKDSTSKTTKDPWNYWVFRTGVNGNISADENYKENRLGGNVSVNRVTDKLKIGFDFGGSKNKTSYESEDSTGTPQTIINKNDNYQLQHFLIKSISDHWSWGYELVFSRSTFSNNKSRVLYRTGIEYAIFPYKEVNNRFFTISYLVGARRNNYFDTTLYDKIKETLWEHGVESNLKFNQKWGTISIGAEYHNYLHNWKYFNLGINAEIDIRITGGLSFNIYTSAELTRDQLFLPKEAASLQEVLIRRRELASGYRVYTFFGINYRFGSKLNNFVNPRFD
ncbi:MAG TPA: hypothetical protein VF487_09335 [Chitinophagaceae bacterium]